MATFEDELDSSGFEAVDRATWKAKVEADLKGRPFEKLVSTTWEGLALGPLYTRDDAAGAAEDAAGFPGLPPLTRGALPRRGAWEVRQDVDHPDPSAANAALRADLDRGVDSIRLRLEPVGRERGGVIVAGLDDLDVALADVDLGAHAVELDAGEAAPAAAAALVELAERRGTGLRGAFGCDPLGTFAAEGRLPSGALEQLAALALWTDANAPDVRAVGVDTAAYAHAGAHAGQQLACALATGVAYLRAMTAAGLPIAAAANQIVFGFRVDGRFVVEVAKLRAARRLWARVLEASGADPTEAPLAMTVRPSERALTERDPWVNMLRGTVAVWTAAIAGADVVGCAAFDTLLGDGSSELGRRVARNTQLVLRDESHLAAVEDPAGGAWAFEAATDALCEAAWAAFQDIERAGGMAEALRSGALAASIGEVREARARAVAKRKEPVTGVSEFPNLRETAPEVDHMDHVDREALRSAAAGRARSVELDGSGFEALRAAVTAGAGLSAVAEAACGGEVETIARLEPARDAAPFEALRDASDAHLAAHGQRPRAFLANLGTVAQHTARATWAQNFLEAGGIEAITNDGYENPADCTAAFVFSKADLAVICSSDAVYAEMAEDVAWSLKEAGARTVLLAGRPGDREAALRESGVDRFVYVGCDVLGTLRDLLHEEGAL